MEVTQGSDLSFEPLTLSHRGAGLSFKNLARGVEGTPENFYFALAQQRDFYSPTHRHNFDQFRYAVKGSVSLGSQMVLREGQLSYHPEAAYYGPQEDDGDEDRIVLVLQCGGASGQGYLSFAQLGAANKELAKSGKFEKGKYYSDGHTKDGFEAIWEHTNGRKLVYPDKRYNAPIIMSPNAFAWKPYGKVDKVFKKTMGVFSEREIRAEMLKIEDGGSLKLGGDEANHLIFVLNGSGSAGAEQLRNESTIHLKPGTSTKISCSGEALEMLHYVMPLLES
ncbi:hypothetical protein NA57DRAFT_79598 [Rhizodiscina lignyota]|uniref:Uncharacterized protein n=1 Tax=Rhizodiscina lignyota TaxID=1504668 RepID=A0A9P4M2Y5_9PEZI|nr:hypothetical protein NA57DRAFT_79598 [Rhizodiscina lignyota]